MIAKTWHKGTSFQKFLALLLPIIIFRFIFSTSVGLIDDEAYHWTWAKELALSYFDHPGLVAWLEAISIGTFGDSEGAVRLPAFLAYLMTLGFAMHLARTLFDEWAAYALAGLMLFTPIWGIGGYVASPEPFFMMFWIMASWVFWQGVREDGQSWSAKKTWLCLGILMGLGLNSKFPMALLAFGFGLYLLLTPARRRDLLGPWPWIGVLIATVLCLPIFVWNDMANWPGFKYQFHDRHTGSSFSLERWLVWWAAQLLLVTPFVYALLILTFVQSWIYRNDHRWRFLFSLAIPTLLVFYIQPFFADYKPHWPAPGYFLLALAAGESWRKGLSWGDRELLRPQSKILLGGAFAFLIPLNIFVYSTFVTPWLPKVYRIVQPGKQWETTWDFSNEFTGWKELGDELNRRQREIHAETGRRPFLAAFRYETTAQTYWGAKQKTFQLAEIPSHYTISQKLSGSLPQMYGLDALIVTTEKYPADPMKRVKFDQCRREILRTYRGVEHARTFSIWFCQNFQGMLN